MDDVVYLRSDGWIHDPAGEQHLRTALGVGLIISQEIRILSLGSGGTAVGVTAAGWALQWATSDFDLSPAGPPHGCHFEPRVLVKLDEYFR